MLSVAQKVNLGPGDRNHKETDFWLSLSNAKNERLLLCKVGSAPSLESIRAKIIWKGFRPGTADETT